MINFIIMKKGQIGCFIAERRKALNVKQRDLARICGISEHALCNLERGSGNPTFGLIEKTLDALGLEIRLQPKKLGEGEGQR